jgi:hypothetical protein
MKNMMICNCCGGNLPMKEVWESRRNGSGNCTGSVGEDGRCFAFNEEDWIINEMSETLNRYGPRFSGNNVADEAQNWLDHDFTPSKAACWCDVGVWDAATAAEFRDAGLSPKQVETASESLTEGLEDPAEEYTDGDPIYATCNGNISAQVIINIIACL